MIKEDATTEMLSVVSGYFEAKQNFFYAGKYLLQGGQYQRALRSLLLCPVGTPNAIELAIETVGLANSEPLTHELIDYLMGETDGIPKEVKYIFHLHMSLKQYKEAANTAILIAREEQMLGNYKVAHDLVFDNIRLLKSVNSSIPADLSKLLMLLHSYMLVKTLIKMDDHEKGAQMLCRVSNNISKFPSHIVPILTSTVIECIRTGLKKNAYEYSLILMKPEYRNKIDEKYKRKIEQIVRRPEKDAVDSNFDVKTPCPYCESPVLSTSLDCDECKNHLPYCIASVLLYNIGTSYGN